MLKALINKMKNIRFMICLLFLPFALSTSVNLASDLEVTGTLSCEGIEASSINTTGTISTSQDITTDQVETSSIILSELSLDEIYALSDTITINANLIINSPSSSESSFLETSWVLRDHHDFELGSHGWSHDKRNTCDGEDFFLGGHCAFSHEEVSKKFKLPPHNMVKISANYHMLDKWEGETAYMKADGKIVWTMTGTSHEQGADICGGKQPDAKFAVPVDVTIPHSGGILEVTFGSTLKGDPCNASYAIDDVMVYLR
ncbi:unnamed protein product [Blepharisma stoltei]|uniref:Uncharacterized protein n=1 Tax=Blepharisma stoltei TaxID=1481888 RepID=A0AAU9JXT0_9CILI|nr:unnamed protein product [Blepharisma stoltei]